MNHIKYLSVIKKELLCKYTLEFLEQVIDENLIWNLTLQYFSNIRCTLVIISLPLVTNV